MAIGAIDREVRKPRMRTVGRGGSEGEAAEKPTELPDGTVSGGTDSKEAGEKEGEGTTEGKKGPGKDKEKKGNARKALKNAVKDEVRKRKGRIAAALVDKLIDGNKECTERVFSFIEKKKAEGAGSSRHGGLTAADLLGSEDEWESETDEALEGDSGTAEETREQEG